MFDNSYPKNCTMFSTSFKRSFLYVGNSHFVGSGTWFYKFQSNIFYIDTCRRNYGRLGFRGVIYVQ
jgi:hypothetical protein